MSNNFRICGLFTTMSPLSHIGETISTTTYLVEEPILQESGTIENVFVYNGNAFRGQLRDLAASYMLDKLKMTVSIEAFHLLFSGGKIGGDQSIDIGQARTMRKVVPMIGLFGGGVGNQILPGKLRVGSSYPVCAESARLLPDDLKARAVKLSYRQMTMEKSYTRKDDSKDPNLTAVVNAMDAPLLEGPRGKKKEGEASTQMRMTSELLIPGVDLYHEIDLMAATEIELGVFVSALSGFSSSPYIGGQGNRGHGRVNYRATIINMDTGEKNDLVLINGDGPAKLSQRATQAKESYDNHLLDLYNAYLNSSSHEIKGLLGGSECGSLL